MGLSYDHAVCYGPDRAWASDSLRPERVMRGPLQSQQPASSAWWYLHVIETEEDSVVSTLGPQIIRRDAEPTRTAGSGTQVWDLVAKQEDGHDLLLAYTEFP